VPLRDIEKLQVAVEGRKGGIAAAVAGKEAAEAKLSTLLPAEKASAEAALAQAQVELDKTVVYAGVTGRVEQFVLRVGDVVNPLMRPAGTLIPAEAGRGRIQAGFAQIEAQVMKVGMIAEVTCASIPFTVIPMVVTGVQDFVAAGQVRAAEQLIDVQQVTRPGTLLVFLEPLYEGGLQDLPPGSSCIANAYTSNHELISSGKRLSEVARGISDELLLSIPDAAGAAVYLYNTFNEEFDPIAAPAGAPILSPAHALVSAAKENPGGTIIVPLPASEEFLKGAASLLLAPALKDGKLLGFMILWNKEGTAAFKNSHTLLALSVAGQFAEAVENLRYQQEERDRQRLNNARQRY
jgi:hypothetical protein